MKFAHQRKESSIYNIRVFHNWVKRELINQTVTYLRKYYSGEIKLLDLAVGKGGDMNKWIDAGIMCVRGFDIDKNSINGPDGAKERFRKLRFQPDYKFYVMNLSEPLNIEKMDKILKGCKFNIVSCQFAIHYFFQSDEILDNFIRIVRRFIEVNGFFIGTTMDGSKITGNMANDLFKIWVLEGNKYVVKLGLEGDKGHYFSDKSSEEYLVHIDRLINVCKKYDLMFIGSIGFDKWYAMNNNKAKLSDEEQQFSFLNFSFVFTCKPQQ